MYNFFITKENLIGDTAYVIGKDFNHAKNVLRLKIGEEFLVSIDNKSHLCALTEYTENSAIAKVKIFNYQNTALPISITLFQGLPKSDKLELIIQKAVELGADEIVPVQMERSIVKLDDKKKDSKVSRWQAIAESAGKQSKRTSIPKVSSVLSYQQMLERVKEFDLFLVPYENKEGMKATKECLESIKSGMKIALLVGPEGGFSQKEIDSLNLLNTRIISLGKRILRAETASITALSMLMLYAEMNLD